MFTQEQKDRKTEQAKAAVADAENRVSVHSDRLKKAQADLATAKATLEWVGQMPVNGSAPAHAPDMAAPHGADS